MCIVYCVNAVVNTVAVAAVCLPLSVCEYKNMKIFSAIFTRCFYCSVKCVSFWDRTVVVFKSVNIMERHFKTVLPLTVCLLLIIQ